MYRNFIWLKYFHERLNGCKGQTFPRRRNFVIDRKIPLEKNTFPRTTRKNLRHDASSFYMY